MSQQHPPEGEDLDPSRGDSARAEAAHEIVERARRSADSAPDEDRDEAEDSAPTSGDARSEPEPDLDEVHDDEGGDVGEGAD